VPNYDYKCQKCETVTELYTGFDDQPDCAVCGQPLKRLITGRKTVIGDMEPYFDENISQSGEWVRSRAHRRELMKRNGLVEAHGKNWY